MHNLTSVDQERGHVFVKKCSLLSGNINSEAKVQAVLAAPPISSIGVEWQELMIYMHSYSSQDKCWKHNFTLLFKAFRLKCQINHSI